MTITTKKFGIEIEFVGACRHEVLNAIIDAGYECEIESWNHITRPHWKITTDSSLHSVRGHANELVSPILQGEEGIEELRKVIEALNSVEGVTINRSCGLHVHLDCNDMTMQQIRTVYERYADYEAQIDLIMPQSRRQSARWCRSIADDKHAFKDCGTKPSAASRKGKFYKVNLTNIATRGSMEFRQHSGTTDFRKIVNWLSFLMGFVQKSIDVAGNITRPKSKARWFNVVRNVFENEGYTFVWSRRQKAWAISSSERVLGHVTNEQIRGVYYSHENKTLNTSRANFDDVSTEELFDLARTVGIDFADYDYNNRMFAWERATDNGWLDGVAQQVIDYMNERQDELN